MANHTIDLGYVPRPWQEHFHVNRKQFNVLIVHRRGGKSVAAMMELIHCALSSPKQRFAYVAPYLKQAKSVIWEPIKAMALKIPLVEVKESELRIVFPNGSWICLFGADNADAIRGQGFHGAVLDEFADFAPGVYGQVILPTLAADNGWLMIIGTPKGVDPLTEMYHRNRYNSDWYARTLSYLDTGALSDAVIEKMKAEMTDSQFRLELECDFTVGSVDSLMDAKVPLEATSRILKLTDFNDAAKILGVDVARQGDDRTVIICRQGLKAYQPTILRGSDSVEVAQVVMREYNEKQADAIMIDGTGGYGAGVIDYLRNSGYHVFEVQFGSKPNNVRFKNKRAEMWWDMMMWLKGGGSIPDVEGLVTELSAIKCKIDDNKFMLESKADMKGRGMRSPDTADAIACTFAFPVMSKRDGERKTTVVHDWDPLAAD